MKHVWIASGIVLVALVLFGAAFFLRPDRQELALMELKDHRVASARKSFESMAQEGDRTVNVTAGLLRIYRDEGQVDKAITLAETYVRENPKSIEALRFLGGLYRDSQKIEHYLNNLEQQAALKPTAHLLQELALRYNIAGEYDKEIGALERLMAQSDYKPQEDEVYRVAMARVGQGRYADAIKTVDLLRRDAKFEMSEVTFYLKLDALFRLEKFDEAQREVAAYLHRKNKAQAVAEVAGHLRASGLPEMALAVLKEYGSLPDPRDEIFAEWVGVKLTMNDTAEVYPLLLRRYNENVLRDTLQEPLLDVAIDRKNYDLALRVLGTVNVSWLPARVLMNVAETSLQAKRPDLARKLKSRMQAGGDPLIIALLDLAITRNREAAAHVIDIQKNMVLDDNQKVLIILVANGYGFPGEALELLKTVSFPKLAASYDPPYIADLYAQLNQTGEGLRLVENWLPALSGKPRVHAENLRGLLLVARGDQAAVDAWIKKYPPTAFIAEGGLDLATRYRHPLLALQFARLLFEKKPTPQTRLWLAEALVQTNDYPEAIAHLEKLSQGDRRVRELYLAALSGAVRSGVANEGHRVKLAGLLREIVARSDSTAEEKRGAAFMLGDTGFRREAAAIFFSLARNTTSVNDDTRNVLFLWGRDPPPEGVEWMKQRATIAAGEEKAEWLSALVEAGQKAAVIEVSGNGAGLNDKAFDIYVDALLATGGKKRLASFLASELDRNYPLARQRKLAVMAYGEGLGAAAEPVLRRVLDANPDDAGVQKLLAYIAYDSGRYSEAELLLKKYLAAGPSDAQADYVYGELMWRKKHYSAANNHYDRASVTMSLDSKQSLEAAAMQASIRARKDDVDGAIQIYQELLRKNPNNKDLRADFADMLLDKKRYDEAKALLSE